MGLVLHDAPECGEDVLGEAVEQVLDELRPIVEIEQQLVKPAQEVRTLPQVAHHCDAEGVGVLECLLRLPEKVVTRTELSQQVWGYQFDPGTNVVDVAMQRLRGKLDDGSSPALIQTVRGVGYLLKAP